MLTGRPSLPGTGMTPLFAELSGQHSRQETQPLVNLHTCLVGTLRGDPLGAGVRSEYRMPARVLARIMKLGAQNWQNFVKFLDIQIFRGPQYTQNSTINMYRKNWVS